MAVSEEFLSFVQNQMSGFAPIESKEMFGGVGFFKEGTMFAMIGGNVFRLRVDKANQPDFEAKGIKKAYLASSKKKGMPYWQVPDEVIEDKKELLNWLTKAYDVAVKAKME